MCEKLSFRNGYKVIVATQLRLAKGIVFVTLHTVKFNDTVMPGLHSVGTHSEIIS